MLKISSSIKKSVLAFLLFFLFTSFAQADALDQLREQLRQGLENAQRQLQEQLQAPQPGVPQNGEPVLADIVVVPSVIGYDPTQATDLLQRSGLVLGKVEEIISGKPAGTIVAQNPAQGSQAVAQSRVDVMIAMGDSGQSVPLGEVDQGEVTIPDLKGMTIAQVRAELANRPLQLGDVVIQPAEKNDGLVIDQHPPAGQVSVANQAIDIIVAKVDKPKPVEPPLELPLQVSLTLDRQQINQGESVTMTAKASRNEPNLEYSFNIGGTAYPSNTPSMTYRFEKAGRFPVTASTRPRGKAGGWVHSTSLRVEVVNAEQPTDALVTVPEVVGLSLQDAIKALQESGLRVGLLSQQETAQLEGILEQQPVAGSKVEKDTAVNLIEASQRTQQTNDYELTLAASKETVDVKEPVAFQALLSPMPEDTRVSYRFIINNENFKSDSNSWTHEFTKSGRYEVIAAALFEGQVLARSNPLAITVDTFWQEPKAVIKPASLVVTQGDGASFVSQSSHDPSSRIQQIWTDESGQNSQGKKHSIDTTEMQPGDYWVTLRIKDDRGFESIARAQLIVAAANKVVSDQQQADEVSTHGEQGTTAAEQTSGQTTLFENVTVQLELLASAKHILTGDRVKFTIVQYPGHTDPANMNYHIIYGDGEHAEISQPWVEHEYTSSGIHQAYVTTRARSGLVKSANVAIWAWPWWLLAGILLTIVFFIWKLLAPLFRLSAKSKQREEHLVESESANSEAPVNEQAPAKESVVSYVQEKDYGEQSVDEKVRKEPSFDVTFQADKDAGEQAIIDTKKTSRD
jgi:beta-lactam-binding protein with PASTA domain/plastocyanin